MGTWNINRAKGVTPTVLRRNVPVHAVFQLTGKDGKPSGAKFANLGYSRKLGRHYSVGVDGDKVGELCGNSKGERNVAVVGTFTFEANFFKPTACVATRRDKLTPGDVFQVPGSKAAKRGAKPALYVHLGTASNGTKVISYNLNTKDIAIGAKFNGAVKKVGEADFSTQVSQ